MAGKRRRSFRTVRDWPALVARTSSRPKSGPPAVWSVTTWRALLDVQSRPVQVIGCTACPDEAFVINAYAGNNLRGRRRRLEVRKDLFHRRALGRWRVKSLEDLLDLLECAGV